MVLSPNANMRDEGSCKVAAFGVSVDGILQVLLLSS